MARAPIILLLSIVVSLLLNACASSGSSSASVPASENYQGQLAAALTPPAGAGGRTREMQQRLQQGIEASGTFASVIALNAPRENNEAEVIIMPMVLEAQPGGRGLDRLKLAVRTTRKTGGAAGIDKTYNGRSSGRGDALDDIIKALNRDLKRKYREPPVY